MASSFLFSSHYLNKILCVKKKNRQGNLREEEAVKAVTLVNDGRSQRYVANLQGVKQQLVVILNAAMNLKVIVKLQDKVVKSLQIQEMSDQSHGSCLKKRRSKMEM